MAGIILLEKNPQNINFIINELLKPENKKFFYDDCFGMTEIALDLYSPKTVIYGIMEKGKPTPIGVVFFTGVIPYRNCNLFAMIFNKEKRKQGIMKNLYRKIANDIYKRYYLHSVTAKVIGKNDASEKILKSLGFEKVGIMKQVIFVQGKYKDLHIYYQLIDKIEIKEDESG